jgi:hypothetical protein
MAREETDRLQRLGQSDKRPGRIADGVFVKWGALLAYRVINST